MSAPLLHAYQVNPKIVYSNRFNKSNKETMESQVIGHSSGIGAKCCAATSFDELASGAVNPKEEQEQQIDSDLIDTGQPIGQTNANEPHLHDETIHIPDNLTEIAISATAGYFSGGGFIIGDQIARDFAAKQKSLEEARSKVHEYDPKTDRAKDITDDDIAQYHAKAAFGEVLTARVKRARFERVVNGRWSQLNSGAIFAGQFVPMAQSVGLASLSAQSFANVIETRQELKENKESLLRAKDSINNPDKGYGDTDDSQIRIEAFKERRGILRGNMASMTALGVGSGVNAAVDFAVKAAPAGAGFLPGIGTAIGLPFLFAGVVGATIFNNPKNGDAHGPTLAHELEKGMYHNSETGEIDRLLTHKEVRQKNLDSDKKLKTLTNYRDKVVYANRSASKEGSNLGKFAAKAEHGLMRYGHKAATLATLGLIPQITSLKDPLRDRVLRNNKGNEIEKGRVETLLALQDADDDKQKSESEAYASKSTKDKLKTLLELVENTPELNSNINQKFLTRIAKVNKKLGTYEDAGNNERNYLKLKVNHRKNTFNQSDFNHSLNEAKVKESFKKEDETLNNIIRDMRKGNIPSKKIDIATLFENSELFKVNKQKPSRSIFKGFAKLDSNQISLGEITKLRATLRNNKLDEVETTLKDYGVSLSQTGKLISQSQKLQEESKKLSDAGKTKQAEQKSKKAESLRQKAGKNIKSSDIQKSALSSTKEMQLITAALNGEADRYSNAAKAWRENGRDAATEIIGEENTGSNLNPEKLEKVAKALKEKKVVEASKLLGKTKLDPLSRDIYDKNYTKAARKILSNDTGDVFARNSYENSSSPNAIETARYLANNYGEKMQVKLLKELEVATDHVLVFSGNKDARRQRVVYSQLSDAYEKTKQEFSYSEDNLKEVHDSNATTKDSKTQTPTSSGCTRGCCLPQFQRAMTARTETLSSSSSDEEKENVKPKPIFAFNMQMASIIQSSSPEKADAQQGKDIKAPPSGFPFMCAPIGKSSSPETPDVKQSKGIKAPPSGIPFMCAPIGKSQGTETTKSLSFSSSSEEGDKNISDRKSEIPHKNDYAKAIEKPAFKRKLTRLNKSRIEAAKELNEALNDDSSPFDEAASDISRKHLRSAAEKGAKILPSNFKPIQKSLDDGYASYIKVRQHNRFARIYC